MGTDVGSNTNSVHAVVASYYFLPRMAFRVDRNYCYFRADLLTFIDAFSN